MVEARRAGGIYTTDRVERLRRDVEEQKEWIAEHGGHLAGYVDRYGSKDDPKHYGDGGEAIYEADMGELRRRERLLEAATGGAAPTTKKPELDIEEDARAWTLFAAAAMSATLPNYTERGMPAGVKRSAEAADAMMVEYRKRREIR